MFSRVYLTVIVSGTLGLDCRPGGRFRPGGPRPGGTRPWRSSSACWRYCSCCLSCSRKHSFKFPTKRKKLILQNLLFTGTVNIILIDPPLRVLCTIHNSTL